MAKLPMPVVEKPSPSHGIAEKQDMSLDSWETIWIASCRSFSTTQLNPTWTPGTLLIALFICPNEVTKLWQQEDPFLAVVIKCESNSKNNADLNPLDMAWAWHGLESTKDRKYTDHYWPVFTCFYWGLTWKGVFYWAVLHDAQNGISRINFCLFEATPNGKNHSEHPWFLHTFDPMHPLCRRPLLGINTSSIIFYLPRVSNSIVSGKCWPTSSMNSKFRLVCQGKLQAQVATCTSQCRRRRAPHNIVNLIPAPGSCMHGGDGIPQVETHKMADSDNMIYIYSKRGKKRTL